MIFVSDGWGAVYYDALNSVDTITDMQGLAVQRTIYQPFGKKTTVDEEGKKVSRSDSYTNRGYTGHESIQETSNLIHMNGRIYDSTIGRFISADPHIQAPNDTQSYNKYSYVKNNPLKYTDPSGYFFSGLKKWFKKHWKSIVTVVATVAAIVTGQWYALPAIAQGALVGFTAGAVGTLVNGGSMGQALRNGVIGGLFRAVGAGFSFGIGEVIGGLGGKALAHGAVSSFMTRARGGKWNAGFWSGFAGTMLSPVTGMAKGYYAKVASSAVVAGTVSSISGGKFANGAFSGAFRFMFNEAMHEPKKYRKILEVGGINLEKNIAAAKNMSFSKWVEMVGSKGNWDYKNNSTLAKAGFSTELLDEFGNFHFGIVSNAFGFNLEGSMYGAGAYQVMFQRGESDFSLAYATVLLEFTAGGYLLPDFIARGITNSGFNWGDNSGDSIAIMQGWDYADGL